MKSQTDNDVPPNVVCRSAEAFLVAADRQHECLKDIPEVWTFFDAMPIYFLYGQAIELMLKSYLRIRGQSSRDLRKQYGHDLLELYRACCRDHLLALDPDSLSMIGIVAHQFSDVGWHIRFRYISEFKEYLPTFDALSVFSHGLLAAIEPVLDGMDPIEAALLRMKEEDYPIECSPESLAEGIR